MQLWAFAMTSSLFIKAALVVQAYVVSSHVDTTLIPVPTDESLKDDPGELKLSSTELKDYINNITVWTE